MRPEFERRAGDMHGNFDPQGNLDGGGGAIVTGWVAWDNIAGEPGACHVRVEVKQTSGPNSRMAKGTSGSYPPPQAPLARTDRVPWSAGARKTGSNALQAGAAEVEGWIEDATGHVYFQWKTTITLV